jgi:EAL and modified HD-GYP domain-containing signal transduction protein
MDIFIARQPILNKKQKVYGYELLYRAGKKNIFCCTDFDEATLAVIRNVMTVLGSQNLTRGKKAFINFTKNLLLSETPGYLPKETSVIEILEDIQVDEQILSACRELRENGHQLALDDFVWQGNEQNPLSEVVHFIKVDFKKTSPQDRRAIVEFFRARDAHLLAEKIETRKEFQEALDMGFDYFQGFFFSRPEIIAGKDIPGYKLNYLEILQEICQESLDLLHLQKIIERDPPLCHKMLTYLNSAFFGRDTEITSIGHALNLLGEKEIRKWASLAILAQLGQDQPTELMRLSMVRARFCETLAPEVRLGERQSELFLMGLFSLMDVFLGRPLADVLENIALATEIKQALMGQKNTLGLVLDLVAHYEKGAWEEVFPLMSRLGLHENQVQAGYASGIEFGEALPLATAE